MKRLLPLLVLLISSGSAGFGPVSFAVGEVYRYRPSVPPMDWAFEVNAGAETFVARLLAPAYHVEKITDGTTVRLDGVSAWTDPGEPRLPVLAMLFELTDHATYEIDVTPGDPLDIPVGYLEPMSVIQTIAHDEGGAEVIHTKIPRSTIYQQNDFWPRTLYSVDEARGGGRRYVRVGLFPFQYQPVAEVLRYYSNLTVSISFAQP